MQLQTVSKMAVVVTLLLGAGMVTVGTIFVLMGSDAKGDILDALLKEKVINSGDPAIPGYWCRMSEQPRRSKTPSNPTHPADLGRIQVWSGPIPYGTCTSRS